MTEQQLSGEGTLLGLLQEANTLIEKRCLQFLFSRHGLTFPQFKLLMAAVEGKAETLGDLADEVSCTRGNLTGVVDRLERDGWVVRERDRTDRRVVRVRLTTKGETVREIHGALMDNLSPVAGIWTPEEHRLLSDLLGRLVLGNAEQAQAG